MSRSAACRLFVFAALLACAGATRVSGQDADRLRRARGGLPRAEAARFDLILRTAARKGLPTSALIDKTLEGEAKHAPPDRIVAVVQQLADNLSRARSLLQPGPKPRPEDISAVADALRRGVPDRAVRTLHTQQAGRPLALPVVTLADLVQVGVPERQALALLQAWADRGGSTSDLRDLPATIERMRHSGTLPAEAAQMLTQAMRGQNGQNHAGQGADERGRGRNDKPERKASPAGDVGRGAPKAHAPKPPRPSHR